MFIRNEGNVDRMLRIVIGIGFFIFAFMVLPGVWQWLAGLIGAVLLITGITGVCPAYRLCGMNTCATQK